MSLSGPMSRICLHTPRDKVTVARRSRRLRKRRRPTIYKNDLVATEIMHSILDISSCTNNTEKKEMMWDWDSCSTFEPQTVEILNHKEEALDDVDDHDSNSTHHGLVIQEVYEYDFLFPGRLSTFIPHVLETIEEADIECPSIRGRVEVLGRPRST